jgi:hypothetical protein
MPGLRKITRKDIRRLRPGRRLYYSIHKDLSLKHCEAYVIIVYFNKSICQARVERIATQCELSDVKVDQLILASWTGLKIIL